MFYNTGPNLTGENNTVSNNIYLVENGHPVDIKNIFVGASYVSDQTYTKTQVDTFLIPKANVADVYTKSITDTLLGFKANSLDMINSPNTKANTIDVNSSLAFKANSTDMTTALALKANSTDMTTALAVKANTTDTYTKAQVDTSLALKACIAALNNTLYALGGKADITDVDTALALKVNTSFISNYANTKPSDLPISTATLNAMYQKASYMEPRI